MLDNLLLISYSKKPFFLYPDVSLYSDVSHDLLIAIVMHKCQGLILKLIELSINLNLTLFSMIINFNVYYSKKNCLIHEQYSFK